MESILNTLYGHNTNIVLQYLYKVFMKEDNCYGTNNSKCTDG